MVDNKYNNVPINEDDMNFLQMFANQAALAIDNAVLYSNVEQRNRELREVMINWCRWKIHGPGQNVGGYCA